MLSRDDFKKFSDAGFDAMQKELINLQEYKVDNDVFYGVSESVEPKENFEPELFTEEEISELAEMPLEFFTDLIEEMSEGDEEVKEELAQTFLDEIFNGDFEDDDVDESVETEASRSPTAQLKLSRAKQKFDKNFGKRTKNVSLTGHMKGQTGGKAGYVAKPKVSNKPAPKIDPTTVKTPKKASEKGKTHRVGGKFATKQSAHADQRASAKDFGQAQDAIKSAKRKRELRRNSRLKDRKASYKQAKKDKSFFGRLGKAYKAFKGESIVKGEVTLNESNSNILSFLIECETNFYEFDVPAFFYEDVADLLEEMKVFDEEVMDKVLEFVWSNVDERNQLNENLGE